MSNKSPVDDVKDAKLISPNKAKSLNPNAVAFVPSSFRQLPVSNKDAVSTRSDFSGATDNFLSGGPVLNTESNADDEAHDFWCQQLPDDITPDFKVIDDCEPKNWNGLPFSGLSLQDRPVTSILPTAVGQQFLGKQQPTIFQGADAINYDHTSDYSGKYYVGDQSSGLLNAAANPWDEQLLSGVNQADCQNDCLLYDETDTDYADSSSINPIEFLSVQFPGFAAESLTEVYYASGCDLNLTIEMLTQLELQVDVGLDQTQSLKNISSPSFTPSDFPTLSAISAQNNVLKHNGENLQRVSDSTQSIDKENLPFFKYDSFNTFKRVPDFASAVRKIASQDAVNWKHEKSGLTDKSIGSSRNSAHLANSFDGYGKSVFADKLQNGGATRPVPVWLETGDAVGNIYSESREEARDYARLRNAYFEQASDAYLIGNKALAKELSVKGQFYNMKMKAAHEKAKEAIYRQRNPVALDAQNYMRGKDPLIDLHGLHVSEALHVLKHELNVLKRTARTSGQRLQIMVCVGTGHHTKGSRTPARLPIAVEQYLLEERFHYTEPLPGLLRVVIQ